VVPDVKGKRRDEALTLMRNAGLNVNQIDEIDVSDATLDNRVADQLPAADSVVMAHSDVTLAIYMLPLITPEPSATPAP
jgi:beta-lactam-binding protein with PASTA domain